MKRLMSILLALVIAFPSFAFAEDVFHFPWGITETDTLKEATEKAANITGFECTPFISPDGKVLHSYYLSANEKKLLGVPVDYVQFKPISDILSDDQTAPFFNIQIEFADDIDFTTSFATLYTSLCESYGEPSRKSFNVTTLTLDGEKYTDHAFPTDNDDAFAEFISVVSGNDSFHASAVWYNAELSISRYSDSVSLSIDFANLKPYLTE